MCGMCMWGQILPQSHQSINQEGYKTLQEGQYVEFNLLETSKGYQALNVSVVKSEVIM